MQNIIRSLMALVTVWLIGFGVVQVTERMPHTATLVDAELLVLAVVAIFAAVRFRAVIAAWVFGAFAAYCASELAIHAVFGPRAAQGGPAHWATLIAAAAGVAIAATVIRTTRRAAA